MHNALLEISTLAHLHINRLVLTTYVFRYTYTCIYTYHVYVCVCIDT